MDGQNRQSDRLWLFCRRNRQSIPFFERFPNRSSFDCSCIDSNERSTIFRIFPSFFRSTLNLQLLRGSAPSTVNGSIQSQGNLKHIGVSISRLPGGHRSTVPGTAGLLGPDMTRVTADLLKSNTQPASHRFTVISKDYGSA